MKIIIPVSKLHNLVIEGDICYLYSKLTGSLIRELDEYETPMVLAAYNAGKGGSK